MRAKNASIPMLGALAAVAACVCGVSAQPRASAQPQRIVAGADPTIPPRADTGHAWAFLPDTQGANAKDAGYLLHVVPRQGLARASAGSVRLAIPLTRPPLAIAAWQGTAMLLQGPNGDDATGPAERSISTLTAEGPLAPGTWDYQPGDHLKLKAALPGNTVPRSIAGVPVNGGGPAATWERVSSSGGRIELALLDESGSWRLIVPPQGFSDSPSGDAIVLAAPQSTGGIVLAARAAGDGALTLWRGTLPVRTAPADRTKAPASIDAQWVSLGPAALPAELISRPLRTVGGAAQHWLWRESGQTLLGAREGESLSIWRLDPARAARLWTSDPLRCATGAVALAGTDAVTLLAYELPEPSAGRGTSIPEAGRLRTIDVSFLTGAVLADLPAHTDGFLSRRELQILWLLFILIGAVILTVVLRTDGPQELTLPDGAALATPLRRVIGGLIDTGAALLIAWLVSGSGPAHWLAPTTSASSSLVPLLAFFSAGCLLCTLGEWVLGASIGKLVVGERVLGLLPASVPSGEAQATIYTAGRPRLLQAFLRNAVRWFMPPMGLLMLIGNNWRHPGDLLARTVVVVRADPEDEPPPSCDDQ